MEKQFVRTIRETASLGRATHQRLDCAFELGRQLYNAALQERMDCYQKTHRSISYQDQCRSLTLIRRDDAAYRDLPVDLMRRSALLRLDEAFKHFFRRVKLLKNNPQSSLRAGFPRFKSRNRGLRSLTTSSFTLHRSGKRFAVGISRPERAWQVHGQPRAAEGGHQVRADCQDTIACRGAVLPLEND